MAGRAHSAARATRREFIVVRGKSGVQWLFAKATGELDESYALAGEAGGRLGVGYHVQLS